MKLKSVAPFLIAIITLLVSCDKKLSYEQAIKRSYGKEVIFSWNKKYIQEDTVVYESDVLQTPIKIISYIDKTLCDPCFAKYFFGAGELMKRFPADSVKFFCIVSSRSEEILQEITRELKSESCIIIDDIDDSFVATNSLERHSPLCRTFLLDSNNRILLTGDVMRLSDLQKLYIERIEELIQNGGTLNEKNRWIGKK
jgi:hypothetical protein